MPIDLADSYAKSLCQPIIEHDSVGASFLLEAL